MTESASSGAGRPYRGVSGEDRREDRRIRLITAGHELFGTVGIAATRVDDVCAAAGLSKRYFYESFASLDDLAVAVVDAATATLAEVVVPQIAEHGWRNPRPVLEAFAQGLVTDPRTARLLFSETQHPALAAKRQDLIDLAVDLWLAADPGTERATEHLASERLFAHAMAGAAGEVAVAWGHGRIAMSVEALVDHLVRIFERIVPSSR